MSDVCEKCNTTLEVGMWPWCGGDPTKHVKGEMYGFDDSFTPYTDTQLVDRKDPRCNSVDERGVRGVFIDSRSTRRNLMKELNLQFGSQRFEDRGKTKYFI